MKTSTRFLPAFVSALLFTATAFAEQRAQLWGTMLNGGTGGLGIIYSVSDDGSSTVVTVNFNGSNGANPSGDLVQGPENKLYGTTTAGGTHNCGVLYRVDVVTNVYTVLHNFTPADGRTPHDLLLAADGMLYGTTKTGGAYNSPASADGCGTIYTFDITANLFAKLHDFTGADGENPQGLMEADNGVLYGMTRQGGDYDKGALFSYRPSTASYSKRFSFQQAAGELPTYCRLMQVANGKLYGMTTWGGVNQMGVVFSYDIPSDTYGKVYDFNGVDGSYPRGTLMQAANGKLYGGTAYGGSYSNGILFSYDITGSTYSQLYNFNGILGANPYGSLMQGSNNLLYGITTAGGVNGLGVIYKYDITANTYTVVQNGDEMLNGGRPMGNVIELVAATTGIRNDAAVSLSLYPNPATQQVLIQTNGWQPSTISISDMSGRVVMQQAPVNSSLDISKLEAGYYWVSCTGTNTTTRTRLVKQ